MRRRTKKLIIKTLWISAITFLLYPVIVHAIPNLPKLLNQTQEIKSDVKINDITNNEPKKQITKQVQKSKPTQTDQILVPVPKQNIILKPPLMIPDAFITPIPNKTPSPSIVTPPILLPSPIITPVPNISCSLTNIRPAKARWIAKNRSVGMGIRYTVDIFELKNQFPINNVSYYYILHDKISRVAKKRVIGNFTINYHKQKPTDKSWELEFNGCGPIPKDDNSIAMVTIYDNDEMLKSVKLIGTFKTEKVGLVNKPSTYIGILNQLDLTETK